jgi:hypothetical protein
MTIEDALKIRLRTALNTTRVYFAKAESAALADGQPYIVFYRIAATPAHAHTGPAGLIERRYQFSSFGKSQTAAAAMSDAARRFLNGFSGTVTDNASPQSSLRISSCLWKSEFQGYNETSDRHQFANDFSVRWKED